MNLIFKGLILLIELVARLPNKILYLYGNLLFLLEIIPTNPINRRINNNLKNIFPNISNKELIVARRNVLKSFGNYAAEFLKSLKNENFVSLKLHNIDLLKQSILKYKVTTCLSGHFCGFELLTLIPKYENRAKFIFCYEHNAKENIFDDWICNKRSRGGAILISSKRIYKYVLNELAKEPETPIVIGALSDLFPKNKYSSAENIEIFNKIRKMYSGFQRIGIKLKSNFLYTEIECKARGEYLIEFKNFGIIDYNQKSLTQEYANQLSINIKKSPHLWIPLILNDL